MKHLAVIMPEIDSSKHRSLDRVTTYHHEPWGHIATTHVRVVGHPNVGTHERDENIDQMR